MKKLLIASLILFALAGGSLLISGYAEVRQSTIAQWNTQQVALAAQAATGIEGFFEHNRNVLHFLAKNPNIKALSLAGRNIMHDYFSYSAGTIEAITRVDASGRIVYTVPVNAKVIGADISAQAHNAFIMRNHTPVVSEVFTAVQGHQTIALAIPVFKNNEYNGCLTILVPFRYLAASYLEKLKLGTDGRTWVLSKKGRILYRSPGCEITPEIIAGKHSCTPLKDAVKKMRQGRQGSVGFDCPVSPLGHGGGAQRLVYFPVTLDNTHWSIAISAPQDQILDSMEGFAVRWVVTVLVFIGGGLVLSFFLIKTWLAVAEVKKRKAVEQALAESKEKYRSLVEKAPYGLFMADLPSGSFMFLNERICKLFGYSMDEGLNMTLWDLIDQREHAQVRQHLAMGKSGNPEPQPSFPCTCNCSDGSNLRCDISFSVLSSPEGSVVQGILRDISDQEHLEKQLLQAQKMEAVGTLSSGIAHDFNNILQAISGYVQLAVSQNSIDPQTRRYLDNIEKSAERASDLVRRLLTFSRKVEAEFKPVDINAEISQAVAILEHTLPKMISIVTTLDPGLPPIHCDPTQLSQVLVNLGSNASDAMPQGGQLVFHSSLTQADQAFRREHPDASEGLYVIIQVSDNGMGMAPETLQSVYDPFFTTKEVGKGTGLGLSIVYGIVRAHNGFIDIQSRQNQGTAVKVYFPALTEPGPASRTQSWQPAQFTGGHEGILLVDDEASIREIGKEALVSQGYQVFLAANGEECLEIFSRHSSDIDMVVLDLGMPGMGGKSALTRLKEQDFDLKILVASGYSTGSLEEEVRRAGAAGFLSKPYKLPDLLNKVRNILDA